MGVGHPMRGVRARVLWGGLRVVRTPGTGGGGAEAGWGGDEETGAEDQPFDPASDSIRAMSASTVASSASLSR